MTFRKLMYFHSVAKYLNFSKAAEECHIAQTAISRAIADLEADLGFQLFYRNHHMVELTPAGKYFLEQTKEVVRIYGSAQQVSSEIAAGWEDSLTIGFGGYEAGFLKEYVPPFLKDHPTCSVVFLEFPYQVIVQNLLEKTCDVIFTPSIRLKHTSNIRKVDISNARYTITVSKDNPLSKLKKVTPEMLCGKSFICPSDRNQNRKTIDAFHRLCEELGIIPGRLIYSNTTLAIMQMVELDMGITLLSEAFSSSQSFNVRNILIDTDHPSRKQHCVASMDPASRPIVKAFMDHVQSLASASMSSKKGEVLK